MKFSRVLFLALLLTAGCDLAPFYTPPDTALPVAYKEQAGWHTTGGTAKIANGPWWSVFGDATLDDLERQGQLGNQSLKAALARVDQATAALSAADAGLFPAITTNLDANRQKTSERTRSHGSAASTSAATSSGSSGGNSANTKPYNDFRAGLAVSYDLDLFGRLRNAVDAAGDEAEATGDDLAALTLNIQSQIAIGYFTIRAYDAQADILAQALTAYQSQYDLTQRRYQGGIDLAADVDQAQVQLSNARAALDNAKLMRAQAEHALAVLTGKTPAEFSLAAAPFALTLPPFEAGVPSSLLERRPDIAAAERRVAAANDEIGIARAAWFPDITLTGAGGFESETISKIASAPALFWSVGPQLAQTIFDGGEIAANVERAEASYREQVADYRQTVLTATQEVEDNLVGVRQYASMAVSRKAAAEAADRAKVQAYNRYRGGIDTYFDVTQQENIALTARLDYTETQLDQVSSYIRLTKAVGGDWQGKATGSAGAAGPPVLPVQ